MSLGLSNHAYPIDWRHCCRRSSLSARACFPPIDCRESCRVMMSFKGGGGGGPRGTGRCGSGARCCSSWRDRSLRTSHPILRMRRHAASQSYLTCCGMGPSNVGLCIAFFLRSCPVPRRLRTHQTTGRSDPSALCILESSLVRGAPDFVVYVGHNVASISMSLVPRPRSMA